MCRRYRVCLMICKHRNHRKGHMGFWPNRLAVLLGVSVAAAGGFYAVSTAPRHGRLPAPTAVAYTVSRTAVEGRAGSEVRAVIVRLTHGGTVWAQLKDGSFTARLPHGLRPIRLVVVLAGGSRQRLALR